MKRRDFLTASIIAAVVPPMTLATAHSTEAVEEDLAAAIAETYADPLAYVMLAFDWGVDDLEGEDGPDVWQREVLEAVGSGVITAAEAIRIAVASGHRIGKSALVAWIVLWAMSTRPDLTGVVTANTKQQLETKTWREVAIWWRRSINAHWFNWTASKFYHVAHPETWFVAAVPWSKDKPEAFAGLQAPIWSHALVIYDEASAVDDIIWETSEGAQGAIWCVFGNPTRNTGRFRQCFGKFKHRWRTWQIDSRTAKKSNKQQIEEWIADYGEDSDFVRVRARGVFPRAGSNQFIPGDLVFEAQQREPQGYGPIILGVDVARFGDDQNALCRRQGDDARIIDRWRGTDTMVTAGRVADWIDQIDPAAVFVDGVGVGGGVVDRLRQMGYRVTDCNGGAQAGDNRKYYNKRAEMAGKVKAWLGAGGCLEADDTELADDLTAVEYGFDAQNRIQLEKKEDLKKRGLNSPDSGEALGFTMYQNVNPRQPDHGGRRRVGHTADDEYDIFNPGA